MLSISLMKLMEDSMDLFNKIIRLNDVVLHVAGSNTMTKHFGS